MTLLSARRGDQAGIKYEYPGVFWTGILAVAAGIGLQLPMFYESRMNHYRLAGMTVSPAMYLGMTLIILGTTIAAWALFPSRFNSSSGTAPISVQTLDSAPIKGSHIGLLIVLTLALSIDAMKPITLSFVAPGAAVEYGLRGPLNPDAHGLPIALYPLAGITGTVLGSFIWGWLGDRIGRRASILIAAVIFISSSTCGTMPTYWLNLLCCLFMGLGVGGMLPVALTLLSETVPARHRGWLMVFVVGVSAGGAYTITNLARYDHRCARSIRMAHTVASWHPCRPGIDTHEPVDPRVTALSDTAGARPRGSRGVATLRSHHR